MHAKLTITTPTGDHVEKLIGNTAILGRGNVHIRIDGNPQVSRFHAMLRCHNNHQYQIVDLGSRNGTFVGQTRVILPLQISDEAYLRLGGQEGVEIHIQQVWDAEDDSQAFMTMDTSQLINAIVMVCDIRGFGLWQDRLHEDELAQKFGSWTRSAVSTIQAYGGVVDKFVRDAVMAYWVDDGAQSVVETVLQTAAQLVALGRTTFWGPPDQPLETNVVMHRGRISLGLGGLPEIEAAASGPTINAAWRLEAQMAQFQRPLLLSQSCIEAFPEEVQGCFESVGSAEIGGSLPPVKLFAAEVVLEETPAS
jgi:adenylate cyclase